MCNNKRFATLYRLFRGSRFVLKKTFTKAVSLYLLECGKGLDISRDAFIEGGEYIAFGKSVIIQKGLRMEAISDYPYSGERFEPAIFVGDGVSIGRDCHIGAINKVVIGKDVLIGSKVYITDHQHGKATYEDMIEAPKDRCLYSKGPVIIEDRVWIGDNVVIMPGVTLGHNSIVAANAVVTKDVPPFSIVAGVPASVIKIVRA